MKDGGGGGGVSVERKGAMSVWVCVRVFAGKYVVSSLDLDIICLFFFTSSFPFAYYSF